MMVRVECLGSPVGPADVPLAQFSGSSTNKVINAVLGLEPLVDIIVSGKDDIDPILYKKRFQFSAQLH